MNTKPSCDANLHETEAKWLRRWEESGLYRVDLAGARRPFYNLMEFPYPSAEGLHVGHVYTYSGADTYGRYQRMNGHDVFEPMGFDAFGINAENYALKAGVNPAILIQKTVDSFRSVQMKRIGAMFDWSREVTTSHPSYYRWTQWIFLQMYKAGLAVRKAATVNWCPSCLTVLANEQLEGGVCERCSSPVTKKTMTQWFFAITRYADRLLDGLEDLDWPDMAKTLQANWIGRSDGAELIFSAGCSQIHVFTTRPDTVFGATYVVLAPEHPLVDEMTTHEHREAVLSYRERARMSPDMDRMSADREKTGVFTGAYARNPANGLNIPVWIADYVLMGYGTGAIMAVPAHDQRDWDFAKAFGLPIVEVISSESGVSDAAHEGPGLMMNSGQFDGLDSETGKSRVTSFLADRGKGAPRTTYRLQDWLISRQRYWGPPIPIVYCEKCGVVPVPESELPVELPFVENFKPLGTGQSPLAAIESFVTTRCSACGGPAQRETDVSDTFVDSSWYFLRYLSTECDDRPFESGAVQKWLPVDMYMGGKEHVCRHHLYARFVTKVLHDLGHLPFDEPFKRLRLHGMILKDGAKMSKSRGNVVNPDEYMDAHGADALRMYLLFLGPFEDGGDFSDRGIKGITRFVSRLHTLVEACCRTRQGKGIGPMLMMHRTIKRVTEDVENLKFNTALAALMEYSNWISEQETQMTATQYREVVQTMVLLLAPFAPFTAEELWEELGGPYSVHRQTWPQADLALLASEEYTLPIQVNGKLRHTISVPVDLASAEIESLALREERVLHFLEGKKVTKMVLVPRRLLNIVVT